jgi:hypothetical protein
LDAVCVGDLLKHPRHHAKVAVVRLDTRLNHPFSTDYIEMQWMSRLTRKHIQEEPLSPAISFSKRMQSIYLGEEPGSLVCKLRLSEAAQ